MMKDRLPETGKDYFSGLGAEVFTIDLYDPKGYAFAYDLSKPIKKWHNYFDLVTNCGTTEHIENQKEVLSLFPYRVHAGQLSPA